MANAIIDGIATRYEVTGAGPQEEGSGILVNTASGNGSREMSDYYNVRVTIEKRALSVPIKATS